MEPSELFSSAAAYADFDGWHAAATKMRDSAAVHRMEPAGNTPFWAIMRHAEVMEVERHAEVFTNEPASTLMPERPDPFAEKEPAVVNTLINMDGADHFAHRSLVADWFKPASVSRLAGKIDELAARSVEEMAALGGECDFASDIAMNFPLRVILSILGLPEEDFPRMLRLTQELFGGDDPDFTRAGEDQDVLSVIMDFIGYFTTLTANRRANPTDDLASVIANGSINGVPLNDMDTFGYYLIAATAGHDTTSSAIAGGMHVLLQHPDQLERIKQDPSLVDNAADEIVRWVTPVKHFMRTARQDYTLGGTEIARGDWVLMSYPSANRDERVFADPFTFDVGRPEAHSHLGFGFGRHYCLGSQLARLEIRSIFRQLIPRLDRIELTGPAELMHSNLVSGPKRLPISYAMS